MVPEGSAILIWEPLSVWWVREWRAGKMFAHRYNQFHPGRKVAWNRLNRPQRLKAMAAYLDAASPDRRMATALVNRYYYLVSSGDLR